MNEPREFSLDTAVRTVFPTATLFVLVLAMAIPVRVALPLPIAPALPVLALFFWLLYRPSAVPALAAFCFGLFHDILSGAPLGIHAIVYVVAHAAITTQRRFFVGKSFGVIWVGFAVVIVGSLALSWALASIYHATMLAPGDLVLQALVTICVYPFFAWLFLCCEASDPEKS